MSTARVQTFRRAARERCPVEGGELRLLSVREVEQAYQEGELLAREGHKRALCSNACLLALALEQGGKPVYPDGRTVLEAMSPEEIAALSDRWAAFNREANPSPLDSAALTEQRKQELKHDPYARLQWRVLRAFGALPTEARAMTMTDRDYLWCALHLVLDREEELEKLCPDCRSRAGAEVCPVCGQSTGDWGSSSGFDLERYERLKGENSHD